MTILHDEEDTRIVQLSQHFADMREMRARFNDMFAVLVLLKEDAKSKSFCLTAAESDAFCAAWPAFKAAQQAKAEAEEQRQQTIVEQAYTLAKEYPAIKIEESGAAWLVSIPGFWNDSSYYGERSYGPDQLLEDVQKAIKVYQNHQSGLKEF